MSAANTLVERLGAVAQRLRGRGQTRLAREVEAIRAELAVAQARDEGDALLTTGAAARVLGVRSHSTIRAWARRGLLEGHQRGGRLLVTRSSVAELQASGALAPGPPSVRALEALLAEVDAARRAMEPEERGR